MPIQKRVLVFIPVILTLVLALPALLRAQIPDKECLACHSDSGMASERRTLSGPVVTGALGRENLTLQVTAASLKGSAHEALSCTDCHGGIKELPHSEKLPPPDCTACHSDVAADVAGGVHASKGRNEKYVPRCANCHGAHQIKPKADPASAVHPANLPGICGDCHGNADLMSQAGVKIMDPYKNFMKSDHWRAISGGGPKAAACSDCHGPHKILPSTDPASTVNKRNIPSTCGKCHGRIQGHFEMSVHGKALQGGNLEAPSCADCHGEHDIEAPQRPTSNVYAATVSRSTCPQCHSSVRLSRRFSLPSGMVKSYQASFHGLANRYGSTSVANCASCHGAHDILPSSDPASSINPKNLAGTCGKCHPGAGDTFTKISIHQRDGEVESPILLWIRRFYIGIIAGTLLALGLHNLLDYLRRYRETIKALKPVAVYLRMTLAERIQHWLLLSTFFILVITGFALKYPDSFWAVPFKAVPHGFDLRGWLHRAAAVLMIGDGLFHLFYLAFTGRGRRLVADMMPSLQDVRDAWLQLLFYVGLRPHGAEFGRFNYSEKVEYLALIWGTLVMVATGFVLWFKTFFTQFLPTWGYSVAELVHFYEAVLAFSTIIIWHLYAVFVHTERAPFNPTWLTGQMTRHDMAHQHGGELADLEKAAEQREAATPKLVPQEVPDAPGAGQEPESV